MIGALPAAIFSRCCCLRCCLVFLHHIGEKGKAIFNIIDGFSQVIFRIINMIMKLAPVRAFGAMAFTIGKYGIGSWLQLGQLIASFYLTCLLFIFLVLGSIAKANGFSIVRFISPSGRAADRARHFLIGIRIAAHAGEDGGARLQEVGGGPGDPDRLLLQPGRHLHLPDHGRRLHRPGDQHPLLDLFHQLTLLVVLLISSKGRPGSRAAASSRWRRPSRRWDICRWPGWR